MSPLSGRSLRGRLVRTVSITMLAAWILAGLFSYRQVAHDVAELIDNHLAQSAAVLLAQAIHAPEHLSNIAVETFQMRGEQGNHQALALEFLVIDTRNNHLLAHSPKAPTHTLATHTPGRALGYAYVTHAGETWRSLTLETPGGDFRIQVFQAVRIRDDEAFEIATVTALLHGLFILPLIVLIHFSVKRGIRPLVELARQISTRSQNNLSPIAVQNVPLEASPLVDKINHLLLKLGKTLEHERRFAADAAHELRTPLSAMRVQAQVALASDGEAQQHALQQTLAGTDRATHLVNQLLRLARLDPLEHLPDPHPVDLAEVALEATDALHADPGVRQHIHLDVPDSALTVSGDHALLATALRNLIENALHYTPESGNITVHARMKDGAPALGVSDDGPGVPEDSLAKLTLRFYRGRDNIVEGSGLGLSIVQRIAELHDARLEVSNRPGGGFEASIHWCRAAFG